MRKTQVAIWGASGHALVVSNILSLSRKYEIVGFLDDINLDRKGEIFAKKPVLGGREVLPLLKQKGVKNFVLGFGHCLARTEVAGLLKKSNFKILTLIHPTAIIAQSAVIDEGTVVSAGVVIDPNCEVGRYAIINNGAIISHDSTIEDGTHICPGVRIGGNVHIGRCSWVGIGSCVIDRVHIRGGSYIGAGSVVTKDIPAGVLAYGNPAQIIKKITTTF